METDCGGNPKREREGKEGSLPRAKARIEREEDENIVYFQAREDHVIVNHPPYDWYAVVKSSQGDGGAGKYVAQKLPHQQPHAAALHSFSAAVGSVKYVFGGLALIDYCHRNRNWISSDDSCDDDPTCCLIPDLWCFDTRNPDRNWFRGASMCKPREKSIYFNFHAGCSVIGGKIYVTGGIGEREKDLSPWGEVYDPDLDMWSPLSQPGPRYQLKQITKFDSSKHVLSSLPNETTCLACYDVSDESWGLIRDDVHMTSSSIVYGDTLFSFQNSEYVSAYSLSGKSWYLGRVNELSEFFPRLHRRRRPYCCVVPLGRTRFGVIRHGDEAIPGQVRFMIITVTKNHQDDCRLEAKVELNEPLHIDKARYRLGAACVIQML